MAGVNSILKSNNYAAANTTFGGTGWKISGDGKAVFNDASIRSSLDIGEDQGTSDATSFHVDSNGNMWSGSNSTSFSVAPFRVTNTGGITASSLTLTGLTELATGSKIFLGDGNYNDANTAFYVDATEQFSLGNKLTWDGNTLTVQGTLKLGTGTLAVDADGVTEVIEEAIYEDGFIGGLTITGTQMYYGAGSFASSNTAFYVGQNASLQADFSLGNRLTWDGNSLTVQGTLKLSDGSDVINAEDVEIIVDEFGNEIQDGFIGGLTINSTQMYYGTGTFASSDTAFYVAKNNNQANFSLGDKLTWNGSTLAISGEVTANSGRIAGMLLENTKISKDWTWGGSSEDDSSASGLEITTDGIAKFSQIYTSTIGAFGGGYLSFGNQIKVVNSANVANPTGVLALKNIRYSSSEPTGSNLKAGDIWLS